MPRCPAVQHNGGAAVAGREEPSAVGAFAPVKAVILLDMGAVCEECSSQEEQQLGRLQQPWGGRQMCIMGELQ